MSREGGGRFSFLVSSGYATVTAASAVMLVALLMVAGRLLPASEYGKFSFALALATIVETLMDIGLGPVTVRTVARDRDGASSFFRHVLGLKLVWVALGLTVLAVAAPLMRSDPAVIRACYLLGISSAIRSYLLSVRGLLQGLNRFDLEAVTVVADRVLLLGLGTLALLGGNGLYGLSLAFVLARLLMFIVVTMIVTRVAGSGGADVRSRRLARSAGGGAAAGLLHDHVESLHLHRHRYTRPHAERRRNRVVRGGVPRVRRTHVRAVDHGRRADAPILASVRARPGVVARVVRSLARRVGRTGGRAGGRRDVAGRPRDVAGVRVGVRSGRGPVQILAGGSIFVFCTWILHATAIATNLDRRLLVTTAIGLGANVALNLLFIPRWGIAGAAWATVVAEAVTVTLLFVQVQHRLRTAGPGA